MRQFVQRHLFLLFCGIFIAIAGLVFVKKIWDSAHPPSEKHSEKFTVKTTISQAVEEPITLRLNGITKANQSMTVAAEIPGNVEAILVSKGVIVAKDTPLFKISLENRKKELASAHANLVHAKKNYESAKKLSEEGFRSNLGLVEAKSKYKQAVAALDKTKRDIQNLTVRAPFEGQMTEIPVDIGSYVTLNTPLATFVSLHPLKVEAFINQQDYTSLHVGQTAIVRFMNGEQHEGKISFISPVAEEKTRTYKVQIKIPNDDQRLPAGMSAEILIEKNREFVHALNPAHVTLDDQGRVGVKIVVDGQVKFMPIEIVNTSPVAFFVKGLPETIELITVGQDFTVEGQDVLTSKE